MNLSHLLLEIREAVAIVTLNRPDKLNALNIATLRELRDVFTHLGGQPEVRVVILTGAGEKAFAAGADIAEIASLDRERAVEFARSGQQTFQLIEDFAKPVICAINGFALGGGCELAMAAHIRIASENAKFGQPEVNLGLLPGYGGTQRLAQLIGKGRALELMMTADMIGAQQAQAWGLVNQLVESPAEVLPKALEVAQKIATKAPIALAQVIAATNARYKGEDGYEAEAQGFGVCCDSQDFVEGTSAFLEKRKAVFQGR